MTSQEVMANSIALLGTRPTGTLGVDVCNPPSSWILRDCVCVKACKSKAPFSGTLPHFFSGNNQNHRRNIWFVKRTMLEKNGKESTPRTLSHLWLGFSSKLKDSPRSRW